MFTDYSSNSPVDFLRFEILTLCIGVKALFSDPWIAAAVGVINRSEDRSTFKK